MQVRYLDTAFHIVGLVSGIIISALAIVFEERVKMTPLQIVISDAV